jgi:hypothetical protein
MTGTWSLVRYLVLGAWLGMPAFAAFVAIRSWSRHKEAANWLVVLGACAASLSAVLFVPLVVASYVESINAILAISLTGGALALAAGILGTLVPRIQRRGILAAALVLFVWWPLSFLGALPS